MSDELLWEAKWRQWDADHQPKKRRLGQVDDEGEPDDEKKAAEVKKKVEELRRSKGLPLVEEINLD